MEGDELELTIKLAYFADAGSDTLDTEYLLKDEAKEHEAILLPKTHPLFS